MSLKYEPASEPLHIAVKLLFLNDVRWQMQLSSLSSDPSVATPRTPTPLRGSPGPKAPNPETPKPENPKPENPKPEPPKPCARPPKPGTRDPEPDARNPEPSTQKATMHPASRLARFAKPEARTLDGLFITPAFLPKPRNSKPETRNPKSGTRHPKPDARNLARTPCFAARPVRETRSPKPR